MESPRGARMPRVARPAPRAAIALGDRGVELGVVHGLAIDLLRVRRVGVLQDRREIGMSFRMSVSLSLLVSCLPISTMPSWCRDCWRSQAGPRSCTAGCSACTEGRRRGEQPAPRPAATQRRAPPGREAAPSPELALCASAAARFACLRSRSPWWAPPWERRSPHIEGDAVAAGASGALALGAAGTTSSRCAEDGRRIKTTTALPARTNASPTTGARRRRRGNRLAGLVVVADVGRALAGPRSTGAARATPAPGSPRCLPCRTAGPCSLGRTAQRRRRRGAGSPAAHSSAAAL